MLEKLRKIFGSKVFTYFYASFIIIQAIIALIAIYLINDHELFIQFLIKYFSFALGLIIFTLFYNFVLQSK